MKKFIQWLKNLFNKARGKGGSSKILSSAKKVVLKTGHARFMCVTPDLYAGTYNLNGGGCHVVDAKGRTLRLPVKESVYSLGRDSKGRLLAACEESSGLLYDAKTGAIVSENHAHSIVAIGQVLGKTVVVSSHWGTRDVRVQVGGARPVRLPTGGRKFFARDVVEHNNRAIVLGFDYDRSDGGFWRSEPNTLRGWQWVRVEGMKNRRPMKVVNYRAGLAITFSTMVNGRRVTPGGVLYFTQGKALVLHVDRGAKMGQGLCVRKGALFYGTMQGWRSGGSSSLWTNQTGDWQRLTTFPEAECWDLAVSKSGTIYAATGEESSSGKVYEVGASGGGKADKPKKPKPSKGGTIYNKAKPFPRGTGLLWKPTADHRKTLVVLAPRSMASARTRVRVLSSGGNTVQTGKWHDAHGENGGRMHFYFTAPGSAFAKFAPCTLDIGGETFRIPEPHRRYD